MITVTEVPPKRNGPASEAEALRRQAFEMALCVTGVDGRLTPAEWDFLETRGRELYQRQLPAIRERAAGIQMQDVLSLLKNP
jgi:hypothetical protein